MGKKEFTGYLVFCLLFPWTYAQPASIRFSHRKLSQEKGIGENPKTHLYGNDYYCDP